VRFGVKAADCSLQRVFAMREDMFDIAFDQIGLLLPPGVIRVTPLPGTKTTKNP
jgi:hypothetical protein